MKPKKTHDVAFYSKTNQMHNISNLFYFGTTLHVSDGLSVHNQEPRTVHTASGICTVLDSWWCTERPSETCTMLFQNKINLRYCASGWFYYRNILRCTVLQSSDHEVTLKFLDSIRWNHVVANVQKSALYKQLSHISRSFTANSS
jgi:hypothetical protein